MPCVLTPGGLLPDVLFPGSLLQTDGLQLRLYFHYIQESPSNCLLLQPPLFLRNALRCKLVHTLGYEVRDLEEIWCYPFLLLPPEAKYLSQGSGAGGGDSGELFCE